MGEIRLSCILITGLVLGLGAASPGVAGEMEIKGEIDWPTNWTVFQPFERDDAPPSPGLLQAIPESMVDPQGNTIWPVEISMTAGEMFDFNQLFESEEIGTSAWLFAELDSPKDQTITFGMGADWWLTVWINGEEVLSTAESGNDGWPPTPIDQTAEVTVNEGRNLLAVRYARGRASALFNAGGPREVRQAMKRHGGDQDPRRFNLSESQTFEERIPYELEEQAVATANRGFTLPDAEVDLSQGAVAGLEPLPKRQRHLYRDPGRRHTEILDVEYREFEDEPLKVLLSKTQYPAEDLHLDVVLWITPPDGVTREGELEVRIKDGEGRELSRDVIESISRTGWFFSVGFPPAVHGQEGILEIVWRQEDREVARVTEIFTVLPARDDLEEEGRIALRIENREGVTVAGFPQTVGVPFPRGVLYDPAHTRLVDSEGREVPLQTKIVARWSRFGAVKWLLCDFTTDLRGDARTFYLEYGPAIGRGGGEEIEIRTGSVSELKVTAGRWRIDPDGVAFDFHNDGRHKRVLAPEALRGAFVEHEDGRYYTVPEQSEFVVEESGEQKLVLRTTGWYEEQETGERFCNYVIRWVFHRDSPVARLFHTWIFTGDGNRDRMAELGWRFQGAGTWTPEGFLTSFDGPEWREGDYLVQFDYEAFDLNGAGEPVAGRTPGVLAAGVNGGRALFGVKDFWQNFPSELEFHGETGFSFYNWPRHNPPASGEPTEPREAFKNRYAHEGEILSFQPPPEYFEEEIWGPATGNGREMRWEKGNPDSLNAQGTAKTEEMFFYFVPGAKSKDEAAGVMQALDLETLRAVVDPVWVAATEVFGKIHYVDPEKYPLEEAIYEEIVHAPARWNEHLGFYGMWLHGDSPSYGINLENHTVNPYRALRRNHHGWPIKWLPFARSGNPEMLKYAEAATRHLTDVAFCHYVSEEVDERWGPDRVRRQGRFQVGLIPWNSRGIGTRGISEDCDYLWDSYYLTGYQRARDVALLWADATKLDTGGRLTRPGRGTFSNMHVALETYQATFDPWFLITAHEIAAKHREDLAPETDEVPKFTDQTVGHFWLR